MVNEYPFLKLILILPIILATTILLLLLSSHNLITIQVIVASVISWICLVIGYYWGKKEAGK